MPAHKTGTREQWLAERLKLLKLEKELTRRSDELVRLRQEVPWVRVDSNIDSIRMREPHRWRTYSGGAHNFSCITSCLGPITSRGVQRARQSPMASTESRCTWPTTT